MITEGSVKINLEEMDRVAKDMGIFYNPVMKMNRDITINVLNSIGWEGMRIADPMAGSGVRALRLSKELEFKARIHANDIDSASKLKIEENMKLNGVKFKVYNLDANVFLMNEGPFDYIDIDPFGPPTKFLNSAARAIYRDGIVAVTATDTSALSGTYPKACRRKYWARPLRNELMHEIGLRILIAKVQLIGAQFERAFVPIYSFSTDHYMRSFFKVKFSKAHVDQVLNEHGYLLHCPCFIETSRHPFNARECPKCGSQRDFAGPLWTGHLWDQKLAEEIAKSAVESKESFRMAEIISEESKIDIPFFYDVHRIWKNFRIKKQKKMDEIIEDIRRNGFSAERTHFSRYGIRTDCKEIMKFIR